MLSKLMLLVPLMLGPLASYKDHKRVLLIFSEPGGSQLTQQLELLKSHKAGLNERDVVVLPETNAAGESRELRANFHVSESDFTVILIGKDGGEKLRQHTELSFEKLAETIDAMPMRQDEMRGKN